MNKLLDNNLFNQEFVPKRHKFCDGRAKSDISLASSAQKRFGMEENMKNRFIGNIGSALSLFAFLTVFSVLSGCGVVQNNIEESISGNGTLEEHLSQPALSELEQSILLYEEKYADGSADASDVRALAELYGQSDRIRRQRDVLEQAYRLFGDEESLTILEQITVNIAEEETAIAELAQQLYDNLSINGYFDDGVAMLHDDTWFFTMMPKLDIGHRRYYLEEEDGSLLCLEVGYNENGTRYSAIWLTQSDGEVLHLQKQSDSIYMLQTKLVDGVYQGAYETWLCLASDGDVYHEQGFFENGLSSGSYDCRVYLGSEAADILSLWSNRENFSFISYYGEFDDLGRTTLTQPSSLPEGEIVYAYDASGKKYLTMQAPDSAQTVFDAAFWGLKTYPLFTPYSVEHFEQVDSVDNVTPQIRIYDSNIEWFDGNVWHIAGSVKSLTPPSCKMRAPGWKPRAIPGAAARIRLLKNRLLHPLPPPKNRLPHPNRLKSRKRLRHRLRNRCRFRKKHQPLHQIRLRFPHRAPDRTLLLSRLLRPLLTRPHQLSLHRLPAAPATVRILNGVPTWNNDYF